MIAAVDDDDEDEDEDESDDPDAAAVDDDVAGGVGCEDESDAFIPSSVLYII